MTTTTQDIQNAIDDREYVAERLELARAAHAAAPTTETQDDLNCCLARTREIDTILASR